MIRFPTGELDVTSKDIDGISDLVVWAPIREGFIDAFDNITFESRLRLVAEALHSLRKNAREFETIEPFADTAKRIQTLLNFRIGVVDRDLMGPETEATGSESRSFRPRKYMYLVATFSGPWEPYIRLIHNPLGTFLDLVLCNCEGYTPAIDNEFPAYSKWVRDNQLDSAIFYSTSGLTAGDMIYLEDLERIQRQNGERKASRLISEHAFASPDAAARAVRQTEETRAKKLGMEALNVLYKLTNMYPPETDDGRFLLLATEQLTRGLSDLIGPAIQDAKAHPSIASPPLKWFVQAITEKDRLDLERQQVLSPDHPDACNATVALPESREIQRGVLTPYSDTSGAFRAEHGALLMVQIRDAKAFGNFLKTLDLSWGDCSLGSTTVTSNIAFTFEGLKRLGLSDEALLKFPKEFRQGMAQRAPVIGDKFGHHPRNWRLPKRNWGGEQTADAHPINLTEIDFVLQMRSMGNEDRLTKAIQTFADQGCSNGFSVLGFEKMRSKAVDHFGFVDGISQPDVVMPPSQPASESSSMDIPLGDILYGYPNTLRDTFKDVDRDPFLFNGSFLVVRKISQDVAAFKGIEGRLETKVGKPNPKRDLKDPAGLLVGRNKDGSLIMPPGGGATAFDYSADDNGKQCPFSAHIRLANPRNEFHGRKAPKIMRRGMSYGPDYCENEPNDAERGIVFMAYCASLAEQYEVIQRWLNSANASNVSSSRSDPLTAPTHRMEPDGNVFTFQYEDKVHRIPLKTPLTTLQWGGYLFVPSRSALGLLAETPSAGAGVSADSQLSHRAAEGRRIIEEVSQLPPDVQKLEWKKLIEDFLTKDPTEHDKTPKLWEAIDSLGGALVIESGIALDDAFNDRANENPAGSEAKARAATGWTDQIAERDADISSDSRAVIVTDEALIRKVFERGESNPHSSDEQLRRMALSIGDFYVCRDQGEAYFEESTDTNRIIMSFPQEEAIAEGYAAGTAVLEELHRNYKEQFSRLSPGEPFSSYKIDLAREFVQPAIGRLCAKWFGIPDDIAMSEEDEASAFQLSAWSWDSDGKPRCPGSFLASSRQAFYPRPTSRIQHYGLAHGKALKSAGDQFIDRIWDETPDPAIHGKITANLLEVLKDKEKKNGQSTDDLKDLMMRNIIGIMIGAIPPMDANLRWVLYDWLGEKSLWRFQEHFLEHLRTRKPKTRDDRIKAATEAAKATIEDPLKTSMCVRPAPDLIFRTFKAKVTDDPEAAKLGNVELKDGDLIILAFSAATQHNLRQGSNDVSMVFGGDRWKSNSGLHACPGMWFALGGMTGILAALMDAGRLKALPANLIIEIEPK